MTNKITCIDFGYSNSFFEKLNSISEGNLKIIEPGSNLKLDPATDILVCSWKDRIDEKVINEASKLSLICTRSTATDHIDTKYANKKGIQVKPILNYSDQATAEFILSEVLHHVRHKTDVPYEISGSNIGFVGFGNIAKKTSSILQAFGANCHYYKPSEEHNKSMLNNTSFMSLDSISKLPIIIVLSPPNKISVPDSFLDNLKKGQLVIFLTIGVPFNLCKFSNVIKSDKSPRFVTDQVGGKTLLGAKSNNLTISDKYAGRTLQSKENAESQIINNINNFV